MHRSVLDAWHKFSEPFEGRVHWMYVDVAGRVTTGVGNLIDPIEAALPLPWKHPDGTLATREEIRAGWMAIVANADYLKKRHYKFAADICPLRLTDADIDALVERVLRTNELVLARSFAGWDAWPADAQLGAFSMAWAVGAGFPRIFKNFTRYANKGDWVAASVACKIRETAPDKATGKQIPNPGTVPRNRANALCFLNAATVIECGMPRDVLWWPIEAPREPETLPPPTPNVTGIVAETARRMYEETEEERHAARVAAVRSLDEDSRVTLPDDERKA